MTIARRSLVASAALACAGPARLAMAAVDVLALKVEYEATSLVGPGDDPPRGRLWRTPTALRHEGGAGGSQVLVARLDLNVGWLGLPELGMAIQTDLDALDLPLDVLGGGGGLRQQAEGRERVNGMDTTRVRVERSGQSGASFSGRAWVTGQGVIARIEGEGESRGRRGRTLLNFRDARIGRLDPSLFEAPRGLRVVRVRGADAAAMIESLEAMRRMGRR
ncbi:MAG: hypothetical protein FJX69_13260 [Alphaproteobacteria bacterium]|nr:hypothetical protein [Alphaproteobacteria bacterium]